MGLIDFIKKQFINVIEMTSIPDNVIVQQFPVQDSQIQYGAQLIVRESQVAVFINEGKIADIFYPGTYTLTTQNLPLLTNLNNWDKLFDSPFKSDVYFINLSTFIAQPWGTSQPITLRDAEFDLIRIRSFGKYSYKVKNPGFLLKDVLGLKPIFTIDDLAPQLKNNIILSFTKVLSSSGKSFLDLASNQEELSSNVKSNVSNKFADLGLGLIDFTIESFNVPESVQQAIDRRSSIAASGDISKLTQFNIAEALGKIEGSGGDSVASLGASLGIGNMVAQQMTNLNSVNVNKLPSLEERLLTLKNLHDKGLISVEDYNSRKNQILGDI